MFNFLLCIALVLSVELQGQKIKVGQRFPPSTFGNVINYKSQTINLTALKKKLVVIDFWNTRCTSCIQSFPKLDSLQQLFREDIQIVLVNSESKDSTLNFFKKRPRIKIPGLPMITADSKILRMFPVDGYPYTVWLDENSKVSLFSGTQSVSKKNVRDFLDKKMSPVSDPTVSKLVSVVDMNAADYFSFIGHCNDSINIGHQEKVFVKGGTAVMIASNCSSVFSLYKMAWKEYDKLKLDNKYGVIVESEDSSKLISPLVPDHFDEWSKQYAYNYQLLVPVASADSIYKIMQADLSRYFGIRTRVEWRMVKSIALKNTGIPNRQDNNIQPATDSSEILPFELFTRVIASAMEYNFPFFDETTLSAGSSVIVRKNSLRPLNLASLRIDLEKFNLVLKEEERQVPVLILSGRLIKE